MFDLRYGQIGIVTSLVADITIYLDYNLSYLSDKDINPNDKTLNIQSKYIKPHMFFL